METQIEDVDMAEVKRVLEDANLAEPNMSKELMLSYYTALKNSKDTASEEDQTRKLNESQDELKEILDEDIENVENMIVQIKEKPFIPKAWRSEKKHSSENTSERNNNENLVEDNILDATKTIFGFNEMEMKKNSNNAVNITLSHSLKFVAIQHTDKFMNAETALKAKLLYAYHAKIHKMKTELAKLSFYPAPLPRITSMKETFPSFSDSELPETYTCRSGRQTKRKIYNEDDDSLDAVITKKVKNFEEDEWLSKPTNKNPRLHKKPEATKVNETNKTESEAEGTVDPNKEKKVYPRKDIRTPLSKKTSNAEIMKRSSLFSDTPKRISEIMFDRLREEEKKKEKEEKTMELFNKTLEGLDEENDEVTNEDILTVDDEEPVRRRVVPPIPGRKLQGRKRNNADGLTSLDVKVNTPNHNKEPPAEQEGSSKNKVEVAPKNYIRRRPAIRRTPQPSNAIDSLPSTSQTPKVSTSNRVNCPICDEIFEENEIEDHAATCGEEIAPSSSPKMQRITCKVCDRVFPLDTNYEVHVKECIAKLRDGDQ